VVSLGLKITLGSNIARVRPSHAPRFAFGALYKHETGNGDCRFPAPAANQDEPHWALRNHDEPDPAPDRHAYNSLDGSHTLTTAGWTKQEQCA